MSEVVFANVLRSAIPQYEKCLACPPISQLADNNRTPTTLVFTSEGEKGYLAVYIYKYFIRYILLYECISGRFLLLIPMLKSLFVIAPQNLVGIGVSYHSNPRLIRLCDSPPVRPHLERLVDSLDTQNLIQYTLATNTNPERISHARRYRSVQC